MSSNEDIIAALLRELTAYKVKGNDRGVAEVEAELRAYGYRAAPPAKRAEVAMPVAEKRGPGRPRKAEE